MEPRWSHVRATGRFARVLSGCVSIVMFGAVSNGVFGLGGGRPSQGELLLWGVVTAGLALIGVRSFMIGVWIGPTQTRVRGWLISIRFDNQEFRRVSSVGYSGLLNEGNLDGSARHLKAMLFHVQETRGPRQYYFAGLIAFKKTSERQVSEIEQRIVAAQQHATSSRDSRAR
ncbi:hypothetical protein BIU90_02590 [Curtobacterium sp. MCBA15_001]|nr:hypothetical protein BIU90_02590 [Curtobacterium sp. MCBA15_001]